MPMAATMLAIHPPEAGFSGHPYPPQEPGSLGASGTLWAPGISAGILLDKGTQLRLSLC